jgi:hypothetical protein
LPAVLLGTLDEGLYVLRFKELYELVLRQRLVSVLSNLFPKLFHNATNLRSVRGLFGEFQADLRRLSCHKLVNVHALECYSVAEASAVQGRTSRSPIGSLHLRRSGPGQVRSLPL